MTFCNSNIMEKINEGAGRLNHSELDDWSKKGIIKSSEEPIIEDESAPKYTLYRYRWLIFIWFCMLHVSFGIASSGFAAILPFMSKIYHQDIHYVTSITIVYTAFFVPVNLLSTKLTNSYGIALPIIISSVCSTSGAFIRLLVSYSFHYLFIGQWINAVGFATVQAHGAAISGVWFADNERAVVTIVSTIIGLLGNMLGLVFPTFFVSDDDSEDYEAARSKMLKYILVQSTVVGAWALPSLFVIRNKPKTPPSASAEKLRYKSNRWDEYIFGQKIFYSLNSQ